MLLGMKGIVKRYGNTLALDDLEIQAKSGEILGIAGPNGAGKSTMIRILAGEETPDSGQILIDGEPWTNRSDEINVAVVHQESQLFPNLTVAENLLIGRETNRIMRPDIGSHESMMMEKLGIHGHADSVLGRCSLLVRQLCEICRALVKDAEVFLFDEPNSALTEDESKKLFEQIHMLKESGKIVILVTHRLRELSIHADRVTIIRDGRNTCTIEKEELSEHRLAEAFVVAEKKSGYLRRDTTGHTMTDILLQIRNFRHHAGVFKNVELDMYKGEVLAVMGVEGSGGRELLRSVCGLDLCKGEVTLSGKQNRSFLLESLHFLPASRRNSLFYHLSICDNLVMRLDSPEIAYCWGYLKSNQIEEISNRSRDKYNILLSSIGQSITSLSGGNQQKVAVAGILNKNPLVLVLEEPTRGVDIQSKADIYHFIRDYTSSRNCGAMVYCTEVSEVFELADRVVVAKDGKLSDSLNINDYSSTEELARKIAKLQ